MLSYKIQILAFTVPLLHPLDYIQRSVAINLEVTICTGVLCSRTFPKLTGFGVVLSCKRLSPFAILCLKISFVFPLTLIMVRKVVVNCRCLGTSGHFIKSFVLNILESLYFYNFFFLHQMFLCSCFEIILWLFCKY